MGYIPLNLKDSLTRLHDLPGYVKEGLPFAWDLSLKNFSMGFTSLSDLLLFPQVIGSLSLCMVFDVLSSNIDEVLSSTHLLMWLSGVFNIYHKDWVTYSGETDRPGELCDLK